ncbi:hypothetical protein ACVWZ4_005048 [Bradyrhizobium sp. USDA 4472]
MTPAAKNRFGWMKGVAAKSAVAAIGHQEKPGMLQEVFNPDEGPVTLTLPSDISAASYTNLKDYLELFLRKAKRQADRAAAESYGRNPDEE